MNYKTVVGIEIHLELKTNTKMFSGAPYVFKAEANTLVNEVDLGMPGTLPCVNHEAVRKAIQACLALNLNIDPLIRFDRKNYYYSDLPKGYQITQQFHPIGRDGHLDIEVEGEKKRIRIERIHMEEDTAKQFHLFDETLIDYNRAGVPLIEIVSKPDISSGLEASLYVEKLKQTLNYLDVSDTKMEEGSMRCDVNVSINEEGSDVFGTKVEIKNLNSIANIRHAIDYEVNRQKEALAKGEVIHQETRRFDEKSMTTVLMRKKEGNVDYKYFPEPNIFPIRIKAAEIEDIKEHMPELPDAKMARYMSGYGLNEYDANQLIQNKEMSNYFDKLAGLVKNTRLAATMLISELSGLLAKRSEDITVSKVTPENLAVLIRMIDDKEISSKQGKEVLEAMMDGTDPKQIVKERGMKQVSDEGAILKIVEEVLEENPSSIADFKNGKDRALGYLVGQVMKKSKGQANPQLASKLVKEKLMAN